ncbi:PAQR family membrane homeostasis protein TrhA [Pontixanthobacter sp.]|uniref:PAQR family membrane homeostasis protein TrhA n=1 Tax=Pontixanthobacter sp. TaxID=2792078 RepID=UPI003C7C8D80
MYPSQTAPERFADLGVHALSLIAFVIAGAMLIPVAAAQGSTALVAATAIYVATILASISISGAYHLMPQHHMRRTLQRWDHAAIYTLIAGTFSPLLVFAGTTSAYVILGIVWMCALAGVWFKIFGRNIETKWSLASYLGLGWFGLFALPDFRTALPTAALISLGAGAVFYTVGTLFYKSKTLRFRYPIWHFFGLLGGSSFFAAIWISLSS